MNKILQVVLLGASVGAILTLSGNILIFVDIPSGLAVLIVGILLNKLDPEKNGRGFLDAGVFICVVGLVAGLSMAEPSLSSIAANVAVAVVGVVYGYIAFMGYRCWQRIRYVGEKLN